MDGQRLVWQCGEQIDEAPLPTIQFEQTVCVPLHEHFAGIRAGLAGGTVRLEPAKHTVAGFMFRHDPSRRLWRVQHL
jgi:hypothetical protein